MKQPSDAHYPYTSVVLDFPRRPDAGST